MRRFGFILGMILMNSAVAMAQMETADVAVEADVCERIVADEGRSSARERASDKAAFKAIEDIPLLNEYKSRLSNHKFNLKVYRLIDNYLEDMKISVINQNNQEVCVRVNAYLSKEAIQKVFDEPDEKTGNDMVLEVETSNVNEDSLSIPPRPQIIINKDIAYTDTDEVENVIAAMPEVAVDDGSNAGKEAMNSDETTVFVDKTEFYDGTETNGFFKIIAQALSEKTGIKVIAEKDNPDYILKTKILKAKVDDINAETGRLQMVTAISLVNAATSDIYTEHQNRFVLFNQAEETAQKAASKLAKGLFEELTERVLPKIATKGNKETATVITPR